MNKGIWRASTSDQRKKSREFNQFTWELETLLRWLMSTTELSEVAEAASTM